MIYNTEEDILKIRKWCDKHELLKFHNYSYHYFDCNETRLRINYFDADILVGVYFIFYFSEEFFPTYSKICNKNSIAIMQPCTYNLFKYILYNNFYDSFILVCQLDYIC